MPNTSSQGNGAGGLPFSIGGITSPPNPGGLSPPGSVAPGSIGAVEIAAGAISDIHVASAAAIANTKLAGVVLAAVSGKRISYGSIGNAGTIAVAGSGDWSVVKNGAGDYTVTFTTPFLVPCNPDVTPFGASARTVRITLNAAGSFRVISEIAGIATDSDLVFIAAG